MAFNWPTIADDKKAVFNLRAMTAQVIQAVTGVFEIPPIPYETAKHSLKAWATYCLRDRGFKVTYAQNADFAVETRTGEKVYFKVSEQLPEELGLMNWIIWDGASQSARVIARPE